MPASIGVNLRVTGHCSQGGRKYMEDLFSVAYQQTEDERDLEYAFFGIYDGHGGSEAAAFAKEHLMDSIVKQRQFWSDNDEDVLKAIRNGYMLTHLNMWKELEKWPKTVTGLPSTAGTTASVAFIRRGKIYIGHVGDSAIVLGYQKEDSEEWSAKPLTLDHKPESTAEIERIQRCGGKVISKAGVPRVVWNRPRLGHKGPIKKNTPMDEIPFLAVARSLGDLWSYNPRNDEFIVSPDPDVGVLTIDPAKFRCLIFGTDGLWNMISPEGAVTLVQATEGHNEAALVGGNGSQPRDWLNPSKSLVDHALEIWSNTRMRADNTSVVTLMLDPPGPPRATVVRSRTADAKPAPAPPTPADADAKSAPVPQRGLTIMTRFSEPERAQPADAPLPAAPAVPPPPPAAPDDADDSDTITNYGNPAESYFMARLLNRTRVVNTLAAVPGELAPEPRDPEPAPTPRPRDSLPATLVPEPAAEPDARPPTPPRAPEAGAGDAPDLEPLVLDDGGIQINEVSSSSPTDAPPRTRGRRARPDPRRDAPAPARPDRVLRSHHEPEPPRPQTRARAKPPADRVVILTRRPTPPVPAEPKQDRAASATAAAAAAAGKERAAAKPERAASEARPRKDDEGRGRATRSQAAPLSASALAPATPLAQKITRSIGAYARELRGAGAGAGAGGARPGNEPRAGRPARRAPRSKENRAERARAAPAAHPHPHPRPRRAEPHELVHSTTAEAEAQAACRAPSSPAVRPRALRSRNEALRCEAEAEATPPCKRTRCDDGKAGAERCARPLGKRASGPWAPALALRNRLRRRLAK